MHLVTVNPRSNYLQTPSINTYHGAFFHGVSGRNGEWFPHDPIVDSTTVSPAPLELQYNSFRHAEFTCPGDWPVVTERLRGVLQDIPGVRFQAVSVKKVIHVEWFVGEPINIERGDLTDLELYARFPPSQLEQGDLFEMQAVIQRRLPESYVRDRTLTIEVGTPPLEEKMELSYSLGMIESFPISSVGGSLMMTAETFDLLQSSVSTDFFVLREYVV